MRFFAGLGTLTVHERAPGDIAGGLAAAEREDNNGQDEQCGDGARIAALRKERGMTQRDLAQPVGVSDKAVSKWERGVSHT